MASLAQVPTGINYQTVIRDGGGNILPNTEISLQMTIHAAASGGEAVYAETHEAISNAYGLVNLVIGTGSVQSGEFASIQWGKAAHYLETAIDLSGSGQFQVLGTTQFLSVPYAQYSNLAGGMLTMTTQERNALENPPVGMQVYNSSTNCLNYYSGYEWYETCGELIVNLPPEIPVYSHPQDGAIEMPLEVYFFWTCTDPEGDPMTYDFYLGKTNPPPLRYNTNATTSSAINLDHSSTYFWKVVAHDDHENYTEGPVWSFQTYNCPEPTVYAGANTTICSIETYTLEQATAGNYCSLLWTSNGDGFFWDTTALNPEYFPGPFDLLNGFVTLTITTNNCEPCPLITNSDSMILYLQPAPFCDAGYDLSLCEDNMVYINGEAENYQNIMWTAVNSMGIIEDPFLLSIQFYPDWLDYQAGYTELVLMATGISPCVVSAYDTIRVTYLPLPEPDAGPDQLDVEGIITTLEGNQPPAGGYGLWSIVGGSGGSIAQAGSPTSQFSGVAGNSYTLKWKLYDENGCINGDNVNISFASNWQCGTSTISDVEGNVYNTVQIGSQCWMKQNLKTTKYHNGTSIAYPGSNNTTWQNNTTGAYAWYNNDIAYKNTYGALYNWYAVNNSAGLCPAGWHVPTDAQWTALTTYLGGESVAGGKMKEAGTSHWNSPNTGATNSSGFSGLPGGFRNTNGYFSDVGYYGYFWSSSEYSTAYAWFRNLNYTNAYVGRTNYSKGLGFSVRCLRD